MIDISQARLQEFGLWYADMRPEKEGWSGNHNLIQIDITYFKIGDILIMTDIILYTYIFLYFLID